MCGEKMYVPSNNPKYTCRKCYNKIAIVDLENVYYDQLKEFFAAPMEVADYLKTGDDLVREKAELVEVLELEQKRVKDEMDSIYRLYIDKKISGDGFGDRYQPLEIRYKEIDQEIPRLQAEMDVVKVQFLSSDQILHEAQDLWSRWPTMEHMEKRQIVESITEKITIGRGDITIDLSYLPSPSELMAKRPRNHTVLDLLSQLAMSIDFNFRLSTLNFRYMLELETDAPAAKRHSHRFKPTPIV
jgi:site-specific DNA recombinase